MYLGYEIRLDITFIVRQFSHHNSDPQVEHFCITKQVLRYLKRTSIISIIWGRDLIGYQNRNKPLRVIDYVNNSYAREINDQRSITKYNIFFR